jgi:hypothetical protein
LRGLRTLEEAGTTYFSLFLVARFFSPSTGVCFEIPVRAWRVETEGLGPDDALIMGLCFGVRAEVEDIDDDNISELGAWMLMLVDEHDLKVGRFVFGTYGRIGASQLGAWEYGGRDNDRVCEFGPIIPRLAVG